MRASTKLSLPLLGLFVAGLGCGKEPEPPCNTVPLPTECPDPATRYGDIAPIVGKYCASPCHYGGPSNLFSLSDYDQVAAWQSNITREVHFCGMPPRGHRGDFSEADRLAILTWILCGALP